MAKAKTKVAPSDNGATAPVLGVSFGNVNIGDKTARLACHMPRAMGVAQVDKLLVGRRLTVVCLARSAGGSDQQSLPGVDNDITLSGVADSKSVGLGAKSYSFGLSFNISDVEIEELARFAKRFGTVTIKGVADIPEESKGEEGGDE